MKPVDLVGLHIEAKSGAPLVLLREHEAPHRVLPIFVGGPEAAAIATAVTGQAMPRPQTHDLMAALVESLDGEVEAAEVTELREGAFLAHLAVRGPGGTAWVDTRPSDAIALAVRLGTPLYVSEEVLDEAGTMITEELDEEAIDEAVEEFRSFLDELDPADFTALPESTDDRTDDGDDAATD